MRRLVIIFYLIFTVLLVGQKANGQMPKNLDSLVRSLSDNTAELRVMFDTARNDSIKSLVAYKLIDLYVKTNKADSIIYYAYKINELSKQTNRSSFFLWRIYVNTGTLIYKYLSPYMFYYNFNYAIELKKLIYVFYYKAYEVANQLKNNVLLLKSYYYLTYFYYFIKRDYTNTLSLLNKIWNLYEHADTLLIEQTLPAYLNTIYLLSIINYEKGSQDSGRYYGELAIKAYDTIAKKYNEHNFPDNLSTFHMNKAILHFYLGQYRKAIEEYKLSDKYDTNGSALVFANIGEAFLYLNNLDSAKFYFVKALSYADTNDYNSLSFIYEYLPKIYAREGEWEKAYEAALKYHDVDLAYKEQFYKINIAKIKQSLEYEHQKMLDSLQHVRELEVKNLQIQREKEKARRQQVLLALSGLIIILVTVFIIILRRRLQIIRQQKRLIEEQNTELRQKNEEIASQRDIIQQKNEELSQLLEEVTTQRDEINEQKRQIEQIHRELEDSINYARGIQKAVLPSVAVLQEHFRDYFIFYRARDKVSGDFYWWAELDGNIIVTVADCTGHGVPGAIMSMLGISLLKEIIVDQRVVDTAEILNRLRQGVVRMLKQRGEGGEQKDGLDLSIINYNRTTGLLQFSGANNGIYIIRNRQRTDGELNVISCGTEVKQMVSDGRVLYELKPDHMPAAIYLRMDDFSSCTVQVEKFDRIYLFSDGYADQIGGTVMKKFYVKNFKKLLLTTSSLGMKEQFQVLETTFDEWLGNGSQIDDVTVLGLEV